MSYLVTEAPKVNLFDAVMARREAPAKRNFNANPYWAAQREDAKHRETIRASVSLEADDDWLDEAE